MGRGSSKASGGTVKTVPYDKWGKEVHLEPVKDENGDTIGYINDENFYLREPYHEKITKKQILSEVDAWRMDDGTYGDEDTMIGIAYDDGSYVRLNDLDGNKPYKKSGIVGVHVSTADYEMVWGGEKNKKTGKIDLYKTLEFDDDGNNIDGFANSISGYQTIGHYKVRVKTTYNNLTPKGSYTTKREHLKKSTVKYYDKARK